MLKRVIITSALGLGLTVVAAFSLSWSDLHVNQNAEHGRPPLANKMILAEHGRPPLAQTILSADGISTNEHGRPPL